MPKYKYATKIGNETQASAVLRDGRISTKYAIEICNSIKGKSIEKAKKILEESIQMKKAIPIKRFTNGVGHKRGKIGAGRYMVKACTQILNLIKNCETNAQFKGLSTSDLIIKSISAQRGARTWRYGRKSRRKMKNTHVEIIVEEIKSKKETKEPKNVEKDKIKILEEEKEVLKEEKKLENKKPKGTEIEREVQKEVKKVEEKQLEKERIKKEDELEKISQTETKSEEVKK